MATLTIKHERFLPGMEVAAYPLSAVNPQRRVGGVPGLAPSGSGTVGADSELSITLTAGTYALLAVTDERQTVTVDATGGTFTLTYAGQTTAAIAFDAAASAVKSALVALSNIGADDVAVTGGPGDAGGTTPYTVRFTALLSGTNVAAMTADATSLTGGAGTVVIATAAGGSNAAVSGPNYVIAKAV
jgi:hypothetical protein